MEHLTFETAATHDLAKEAQLEQLRQNLARNTYPGYPKQSDRLVLQPDEVEHDFAGRIILPEEIAPGVPAPWHIGTHKNRDDHNLGEAALPTEAEQAKFLAQGLELDSLGRPLHPWFWDMLHDPEIGIVTGTGAYWDWGKNETGDSVVIQAYKLLVMWRKDTGEPALVGGFKEGDPTLVCNQKEQAQEVSIVLPNHIPLQVVYDGPVADTRFTAHAWPHTTAVLYIGDDIHELYPKVGDPDEVLKTEMVPLEKVLPGPQQEIHLHGSHNFLLQQALRVYYEQTRGVIYESEVAA